MGRWEMFALTDVSDFQGGTQPPKDEWLTEPADGYIRMLQIRDFTQERAGKEEYVKQTEKLKTCDKDDILIGRYGASVGKILTGLSGAYNVAIVKTMPNDDLLYRPFFKYYLQSPYFQNFILNVGSRAAQAGFNKDDLARAEINLPDLPVQQQIADVLDRASALIKKRKAQIDKLDLLVKSQFIEMFGDPATNPMGWEVKKLGDIFDVGSSKRIYQNEQTTSGVPFFRISDLVKRIENATGSSKLFISDEQYNSLKLKGLVPKSGDILVTSRGTLGQCYIICGSDKFYFQDGMISWLKKGKADVESIYITYLFMIKGFRKQIDEVPAGSTVNYLSIDRLEKLITMYPDYVLQNTFATFVERVEAQKSLLQKSLELLELNYKSLMQKFFRGDVLNE